MFIGNNNTPFNAFDMVATWLDDAIADIGWRELMRNDDRTIGKLVAGYEIHGLLISISAWIQGNCLDIDVLDTQSNAITLLCAGPCEHPEEVLARLDRLQQLIKNAQPR
jgi:hypothetical protein